MAEYDSSKKYKWDNKTEFTMSGGEFGLVLNTFRSILLTPEAEQILLVNEANKAVEKLLKQKVESGEIIEEKEPPPAFNKV